MKLKNLKFIVETILGKLKRYRSSSAWTQRVQTVVNNSYKSTFIFETLQGWVRLWMDSGFCTLIFETLHEELRLYTDTWNCTQIV